MAIGATGIGSGLDIESLVSQLVIAETASATTRLVRKEASFQAELSAFGSLKSALSNFDSAMIPVTNVDTYQSKTASSSNVASLTATASSSARSGSYVIAVTALARAQSQVANADFTSPTDSVGTGTLTLSVNGVDTAVQIASTQQSLSDIATLINESAAKVDAAVIFNGSAYKLALTSQETGLANVISISVADDDGNNSDSSGLSRLATANLSETVAALDASFSINGLSLTNSSNTVSNAIDGVSLSLLKPSDSGETISLSIADNTMGITSAVKGFVDGFNELWGSLSSLTNYDADSGTGSVLTGDSIVRSIEGQLRLLLNSPVENGFSSKSLLAEIGVTTNSISGNLELDESKLTAAISSNPEEIGVLFTDYGLSSSPLARFNGATSSTQEGIYGIEGALDSSTAGSLGFTDAVSDFSYNGNGNDANFNIAVDGGAAQAISLSSNLSNMSGVLTELNSQITGATVTDNGSGALVFTSDSTGSGSSVTISGADTNAVSGLKISNGSGTQGTSTYSYSIGGFAASLEASTNKVTSTSPSPSEGLSLELTGNGSGLIGSIAFSKGVASEISVYIESLIKSGGTIEEKINGIQSSVTDISEQQEALELRAAALEARYRRQFNALDGLIAQLNTTQSFLSSALSGFVEPNTTLRK